MQLQCDGVQAGRLLSRVRVEFVAVTSGTAPASVLTFQHVCLCVILGSAGGATPVAYVNCIVGIHSRFGALVAGPVQNL